MVKRKWESGKAEKRESGKVGKRKSGKAGKRKSGKAEKRESGKAERGAESEERKEKREKRKAHSAGRRARGAFSTNGESFVARFFLKFPLISRRSPKNVFFRGGASSGARGDLTPFVFSRLPGDRKRIFALQSSR